MCQKLGLGPNYNPTKFCQNIPSFRAPFMRKTDEKRSKRLFFQLWRLIARPPGGGFQKQRITSFRLDQNSIPAKFCWKIPKNKKVLVLKLPNWGYLIGAFTLFFFARTTLKKGTTSLRSVVNEKSRIIQLELHQADQNWQKSLPNAAVIMILTKLDKALGKGVFMAPSNCIFLTSLSVWAMCY